MNSETFWQLFMETGAPEMYMLYNKTRKMEESHVSDNSGPCAAGNSLQ